MMITCITVEPGGDDLFMIRLRGKIAKSGFCDMIT